MPFADRWSEDIDSGTHEVRREVRMWESNLRKSDYTHVGIDVLENPLRGENQAHGKADQHSARRTLLRSQKKAD